MQTSLHVVGQCLGFFFLDRIIVVGWFFILTLITLFALGFPVLKNRFNRQRSWSKLGKKSK